MSENPTHLELTRAQYQEMLAHVQACLPEEACGLLGGQLENGRVVIQSIVQVENELHSPVRFRMAPVEQLQAFYQFEEQGIDLAAVYHSHPAGPPDPSPTDLSEFAYPGVVYLIWSPAGEGWQLRGFTMVLGKERVTAHDLEVVVTKG